MARKKKALPEFEFGKVANDININMDENTEIELNLDTNSNNDIESPESALNTPDAKVNTHKFKGYYLDKDVADAIDNHIARKYRNKKMPKGVKSDYVNKILKNYLKQEGLL